MTVQTLTIRQIADVVGGTVEGDDSIVLRGVGSIDSAGAEELTFAVDKRWVVKLERSRAGAAIVGRDPCSAPMPLIRVDNVQGAVAAILAKLAPPEDYPPAGVDPTAAVSPDARIAEDAAVGPCAVIGARVKLGARTVICAGACIGADVVIGDDCIVGENAVIRHDCVLGRRVRIGPGSVIGADGFGFYFADGVHNRIVHAGNVVIEDDVEIQACSCVDRAKFGSTRIGAGTKVDNLVQIAHNVQMGRDCLLAAHSALGGSVETGDHVVMGGYTAVREHSKLADGVSAGAFTAIHSDIVEGRAILGIPATDMKQKLREFFALAKLPELLKRVRAMEKRLKEIDSAKDNQ